MADEQSESLKQSTEAKIRLTDAQVVALLENGGAYVEQAPTVELSEGRLRTYAGHGQGEEPHEYLEYHMIFEVPGCDATVSQWARIVITGRHPSGAKLEIRGKGMVGYDQRGFPQGHFTKPPAIRVVNGDTAAEELKRDAIEHGAIKVFGEAAEGLKH